MGLCNAQYVTFYAHGVAANSHQLFRFFVKKYTKPNGQKVVNKHHIFYPPYVTFNFPDSNYAKHREKELFLPLKNIFRLMVRGNYNHTSLAQLPEVLHMNAIFKNKINPDDKVIYGGLSRGASIFFTWITVAKPTNVVAAVLESPFARMEDVIKLKIKQFGLDGIFPVSYGHTIMETIFKKYKRNGATPLDCAPFVDKEIPILIIASTTDSLISWKSSFELYKALRKSGHEKAHFLLLHNGWHGFLMEGADAPIYEKTVHAFYKKYNLPHDQKLAEAGQHHFEKCTPAWQ